jgi:Regulator of chromosome condensation (RCC1) repeat/PASTA domain
VSARARSSLRLCAPAVLSVGLLFAPGAAQATTAGTVVAWGCGADANWGQCSVPSGLARSVAAVAAGRVQSLALKGDGTVVAWGCGINDYGQCSVPSGLSGVTAIAANDYHSLALKHDGTVVAWGCGGLRDYGQCSVPVGLTSVTAIAAGVFHSVASKADGTVVTWGCGIEDRGQCSVPVGLSSVIAVTAGQYHSLALKSDGTVVAWGCIGHDLGQCSVPNDLSSVTAIAVGFGHSLALKDNGTVVAWGCGLGSGSYGQCNVPNGLSGVTAIAASDYHSLALKSDGTVVAWGCGTLANRGQCDVPTGLSRVTAIAAGYFHSLALAEPIDQTITFDPIADRTYGYPGTVVPHATASSGLPVSFSARGACFFYVGVVYITSGGFCTVTASQPGGLNFNPAPDVSRTFAIVRVSQSITFPPLVTKMFGDADFAVSAFSSSALPVSFAAGGNCAVSGVIVHLTGAGSCTITASQVGDVNWEPAPDVSQTFAIVRAIQPPATPVTPARCRVPAVVGKRLVSAKQMIAKRHCRTGKVVYAYSRKRNKGIVISQNRRPGRVLPARSKVALIVSRGRTR